MVQLASCCPIWPSSFFNPAHECNLPGILPGVATPVFRRSRCDQRDFGRQLVEEEVHLGFPSSFQYSFESVNTRFINVDLFHLLTTLPEKKYFLISSLLLFFEIFDVCSLVLLSTMRSKVCKDMLVNPAFNLNTSSRSGLLRHSSTDRNPSLCNLP